MNLNHVTDTVLYIGVNDHAIDLFEGQYVVPNGMAYNSYVVMDKKIAHGIGMTHSCRGDIYAIFSKWQKETK